MYLDISNQRLPKIYKRNGKDCYFDPIRKKLIYITPEETVRQQVISYLIDELDVPSEMISVESHLSHYGLDSRKRTDILIHGLDKEGKVIPLVVIECKSPDVVLSNKVGIQITEYCDLLGCDYAMMINGKECFSYRYEEDKNQYLQIESLPKYEAVLKDKYKKAEIGELPPRIKHNEIPIFVKENRNDILEIGLSTEYSLACAAYNFLECLFDVRNKMPIRKYEIFDLIEDCGVRRLSYGNNAGGQFEGFYRSFLINHNGNTDIVSIGMSWYNTSANPEFERTTLNIAIDNEKVSHHALQLVLDENVEVIGNTFSFFHHGRIAIGNQGSGKVAELRELIYQKRPQLIYDKRFYLGKLVDDRLWALDDEEVIRFVENLISYALIRDEYRAVVKARK